MTRSRIRVVTALLFCGVTLSASQAPPTNRSASLLADFTSRLNEYVAVRDAAVDKARPLEKTDDPALIRLAQQDLAARIRAARPGAKQGDIFTPAIAAHFRRLVRPESKEPGTRSSIKDDNPGPMPFTVNGPYPDKEPLATVPPNVIASLPPLPKDIDYRFVGRHLLLRDSRANLVIDYVPNALP